MKYEERLKETLGIKDQATEKTLQSIASTLERIELILAQYLLQSQNCTLDAQGHSQQIRKEIDEKETSKIKGLTIQIID